MEEIMTTEQLKDYIRGMPEDEIIKIRFEERNEDGRDHEVSEEQNI